MTDPADRIDPAEHIGLAHFLAGRYSDGRGRLADDIFAAARLALVRAAAEHDPRRGPWSTHVAWAVLGEVTDLLRRERRPGGMRRAPTGEARPRCSSVDRPTRRAYLGEQYEGLVGVVDHRPGSGPEAVDDADAFEALLACCRPRVADVLRRVFRDGLGDREIGADLGLTWQRVQQLRIEGLRRIRERLEGRGRPAAGGEAFEEADHAQG